jgi:putative FmdB family regulatory protein
MPTYEYEHDGLRGENCPEVIEVTQPMTDEPLHTCPYCFHPVHRIVSMPLSANVQKESKLTDRHLENTGFTKYVNRGDGTFEKAAGPEEAPEVLNREALDKNLKDMGLD